MAEDINTILGISENIQETQSEETTQKKDLRETKNCPYCGEEILAVAKKCKHCGEWLVDNQEPQKKLVPCPICGEQVEEGIEICPHCNEKISSERSSEPSIPITIQPSQPTSQELTKSSTLFKNFMVGKSLSGGLVILCCIRILFDMLMLFDNPAMEIITTITDLVLGSMMALLVIQRVAQTRNTIDIASFMAIGSSVLWPVALYMGYSGVENMGIDAFEYVRWDDSNEGAYQLRYAIYCGLVYYILSLILDIVSKISMYTTAKSKFKSTLIVGIITSILGLLYVLSVKSMSEGLVLAGLIIIGLIQATYYIMILINGTGKDN